jgi:hypothetical protein
MLGALFVMVALGQGHAPKDVPRSHWAYSAVDELFAAGILHGYADDPIRLTLVAPDSKWILGKLSHWKQMGLMAGFPFGLSKQRIDWNRPYEQTVAIHFVWMTLCASFADTKLTPSERQMNLSEFDDVAQAISMRAKEITKLQGDPQAMLNNLARIRSNERGTSTFGG